MKLRPLELDKDREALYEWENDVQAWTSSGTLNPISYDFVDRFIIASNTSILEKQSLALAIEVLHAGVVGYVQLFDYDAISRRVSVGIYIAPKFRRQGYASECVGLVHSYLKQVLNCVMVYVTVLEGNAASKGLFERLGYQQTARLVRWHWREGSYHDLIYYQLWLQ